jgi:hypothetical protein
MPAVWNRPGVTAAQKKTMMWYYVPAVILTVTGIALIIIAAATVTPTGTRTLWAELVIGLIFLIGGMVEFAQFSGYAHAIVFDASSKRR